MRGIKIVWLRGYPEAIKPDRPHIFFALGRRGSGKSAFLETVAENYLSEGNAVLDLFGASSGEGLAWLRSDWVKKEGLPTLLITGKDVDVLLPSWLRGVVEVKPWVEIGIKDFSKYRIVVSSTPLYSTFDEEFIAAGRILDLLFTRFGWRRYLYVLVREAANLFYSRVKLRKSQLESKSEAVYLIRESRHHGLALGLDSQKFTAIDADLRQLVDYLVIRNIGASALPDAYEWIFRYVKPDWIRRAPPYAFTIISASGNLGIGVNELPRWHKRAKEHIIRGLGLIIRRPSNTLSTITSPSTKNRPSPTRA